MSELYIILLGYIINIILYILILLYVWWNKIELDYVHGIMIVTVAIPYVLTIGFFLTLLFNFTIYIENTRIVKRFNLIIDRLNSFRDKMYNKKLNKK